MVYSTRRFVLCLTCVILFLCFSVLLALRLPRLGKRELILALFIILFDLSLYICSICACLDLSVSSSSHGVCEGLRLVIVALPGLFSYLFFIGVIEIGCCLQTLVRPLVHPGSF